MKIPVYTSGEDGYHTYRIPSIIRSQKGTLLAFCEGRRNSRSDQGDIDLLVKRSEDGGDTWSGQTVVYAEPGDITIGNPCPVVDDMDGTIWMPFCRDNDDVLMTHSKDDGMTWSKPVDITAEAKRPEWIWYATGPGIGIQLQRGPRAGRLVIPCDHRSDYGNGSHMIYSDDHGATWQVGDVIQPGHNECQVAELADGRLLMNVRMQRYSEGFRGIAYSENSGETWTDFSHDQNLVCPKCQAGLLGYSDGSKLIFSNPFPHDSMAEAEEETKFYPGTGRGQRVNMTIRLSEDGGKSWIRSESLFGGPSGYSCLVIVQDGSVGCLYECGESKISEQIVFERFNLE
jgi:sialidase-1